MKRGNELILEKIENLTGALILRVVGILNSPAMSISYTPSATRQYAMKRA